jgi:hypothetical protein
MFLPQPAGVGGEAFSRRLLPSPRKRIRPFANQFVRVRYLPSGETAQFTRSPTTRSVHFWVLKSKVINFAATYSNGHYLVLRDPLATEPSRGGTYHGYLAGSAKAASARNTTSLPSICCRLTSDTSSSSQSSALCTLPGRSFAATQSLSPLNIASGWVTGWRANG